MDLLKSQLERIQRQLGGLTPSQKMLTFALVAIMVMTLVWWGRYAGEPDMEPLFSHAVSPEALDRVIQTLESNGIKHTSSGTTLMVPADQKLRAYSILALNKSFPRDKDSFDDLIKNVNPLQAESTTDKIYNRARELALGQLIRDFPGVSDAQVLIAVAHEIRIGGGEEPRATITIQTQDSANSSKKIAEAAASLVEGSQTGLALSRIRVVINGKLVPIHDPESDDTSVAEANDRAHREEIKLEERIRGHFAYITGVLVNVAFSVNITKTDQSKVAYDTKTTVSKEIETQNTTEENTNPSSSAGEGGTVPNTRLDITGTAASSGSAGSNTKEQNSTKTGNWVGHTETHTQTPAGESAAVGASIKIPRDYFIQAYKLENKGVTEVSKAVLEPYIASMIQDMTRGVIHMATWKESDIAITTYIDPTPAPVVAPATASMLSTTLLSTGRLKEVVLAVMALVSLFMVSSLVKKGTPVGPVVLGTTTASTVADALSAQESALGEVGLSDPSLDGVEMDEETLRGRQVAQQVTSLVKENPDNAAALVKRWLART